MLLTRTRPIRLLYALLGIVHLFLLLRFVFRLLGANPATPFVAFLYSLTEPLVFPFRGIFAPTVAGGVTVEWAIVIAMVIYSLLFELFVRLIGTAFSTEERTVTRSEIVTEDETHE